MRWWPRSIRWQMLAGLMALEVFSLALFVGLLMRQQWKEENRSTNQRLLHQTDQLALEVQNAWKDGRQEWIPAVLRMTGSAPGVQAAKIADSKGKLQILQGKALSSEGLDAAERVQMSRLRVDHSVVFSFGQDRREAIRPVYVDGQLRGYVLVESDREWDEKQLFSILELAAIFGGVWTLCSLLLVLLMSSAIARPLATLHRGTRALMESPEMDVQFPLPVEAHNEFGELIEAFNRMFASIMEQRAGLNDTLSLLDSMLANAPIGLAFFDRRLRFVRVNQVFASMTGVSLSRHLGRILGDLLPEEMAEELEKTVMQVFAEEEPVRNLEVHGESGQLGHESTWLASVYPVRTPDQPVRWVGLIVLDASERKRSEEALRKSEKLAATGRLAASIAHEINNPLEAITNLLFILHHFSGLDEAALQHVEKAEHEARRISEITQQTLRFYRQSTLPVRANMAELVDSVLSLYHGRLNTLSIEVERDFEQSMDLFCFAGEIRQVMANLVGNAIDAMNAGGRLVVRARRSHSWSEPGQSGVRIAVADTGIGMSREVCKRVFEAFFTTKAETGTGLGLWVSEEIIRKHHGRIHLRSRTARDGRTSGTVFQLFLPDDEALLAPKPKEPAETAAQ